MFRLNIKTGNAAFGDGDLQVEVARILREVAAKVEEGLVKGKAFDVNGNHVGDWSLS